MARLEFQFLRSPSGETQLGESPCWDPGSDDLWWVDVTGRKLFRADTASGATRTWDTPEEIGFVVLLAPGCPAVGMESGIFAFDPQRGAFERLLPFEQAGCRFNDAAVDSDGRLWVSTMAMDLEAGRAAVHRVTPDLGLQTVARGLTIPNGLAVDLERGRLFYSDSDPGIQSVWTRSLKAGTAQIGEASRFATSKNLAGRPDGAALDEEGFYWIAGVDGGELYVFGHDGALRRTLSAPFPAPTKLSFAGPAGRRIALTSKAGGKEGGSVALAELPAGLSSGIAQPYWRRGAP